MNEFQRAAEVRMTASQGIINSQQRTIDKVTNSLIHVENQEENLMMSQAIIEMHNHERFMAEQHALQLQSHEAISERVAHCAYMEGNLSRPVGTRRGSHEAALY